MEDADNYKANRGGLSYQGATNIFSVFINRIWKKEYNCGLYANLDWLTNRIDVSQLGGVSVWCAQYNRSCDYDGATLWQYTDRVTINGQMFDASVFM